MSEKMLVEMDAKEFSAASKNIIQELSKIMVGQETLIHELLVTLLSGGNALLEGVPGLGKTVLIKTLSQTLDCSFSRIQFTPDLMPADIVGTMILTENMDGRRGFRFEHGPVFTNLLLADEINRAAPRTQSALLEAMQEQRVTVANETYDLPQPFFVLATQNPIEMEGTYPLPEAQLDRFLYKILVDYPDEDELIEIARRTTTSALPEILKTSNSEHILQMQRLASEVPVEDRVFRYAARLTRGTHPENDLAPQEIRQHLRVGVSPRGIQALIRAGKVEALLDGRKAVAIEDVRKVAYPALRHRMIMTFEAQAEGVPADLLIEKVIESARVP
jgi:MoxR-like ATPase